MNRRFLSSISCKALLTGSLFTASIAPILPQASLAASAPSQSNEAAAPISELYKALEKAENSSAPSEQRSALIAPAIEHSFNLDTILKRSIGLHYDTLSPDERAQLLTAFQRFTTARYTSTFKPGTEAVFTIASTLPTNTSTGGVIVHTTIRGKTDPESSATPIDYLMNQTPNGWRISDILLNGHISQVAAQRADFKSIFNQGGARGLSRSLTHKADDFLHE